MLKPISTTALLMTLLVTSGCGMFSNKHPHKESSAIASDVEETFRRRWVDKRVSELTAQGVAAETARPQAESEFREKYAFDQRPKK